MTERWVIRLKLGSAYVHFRPQTGEYFVGQTLLGACIFSQEKGLDFLKEADLEDQWELQSVQAEQVIKAPRSLESVAYNSTHNSTH